MARSRNIKPAFFSNEDLADLLYEYRILFIGLLCMADREGRLEYRVKKIKATVFPYDDGCNVQEGLDLLAQYQFIEIYALHEEPYIRIIKFHNWCSPEKSNNSAYYSSNRRAFKRQAIPPWADRVAMKKIYDAAKVMSLDGEEFHVDHVIPLKSHKVCGLHVEANLQIITAIENIKKSNKFNGETYA